MNETIQYLDYAGLTKFKEEIDKVILANKNDIIGVINEVSGDIGNGTLTIKKNNTSVGTFTANQKTNADINITVPTALSDLTFGQTTVNEIINIIKYGQLDISSLTDAQKTALHETIATSFGYMSQTALATQLEGYGTTINYDSSTQKVQLKNGNTVLSEFSSAAFIKDGMISSVSITDGTGTNSGKKVLLIDFNADSGITDIEIPIEDIFDASKYTKTEDLATVAISGSYNDLLNKPHIPNDQVQADWSQTGTTEPDYIKNKPTNVSAFTNDAGYLVSSDIAGKADKTTTYTKTEVDNLVSPKANSSDLATVATSGNYSDLSNTPATLTQTEVNTGTDTTGKLVTAKIIKDTVDNAIYGGGSSSGTVITTTNISSEGLSAGFAKSVQIGTSTPVTTDANGKISLPAYPDISGKANSSDLATVATSGSYNDLSNTPTIVSGVKVGESGSTISPVDGIITIPEIDSQIQSDWEQTTTTAKDYIKNKPEVLTNASILSLFNGGIVDTSGNSIVINTNNLDTQVSAAGYVKSSALATVATSGSYTDLTDKPTIPSLSGYATETWVSDKFDDVLGINASGISALTTALADNDKATGILTAIAGKQDALVFNSTYNASTNKVATMLDIPSTLPASDVQSWAKAASKPFYAYGEIGYTANTANNSSTTLTIDGSVPLHVITTTANITAITFTNGTIPADGHSCHLLITGDSAYTVAINNNATMSTVDNVAYTSVCPEYANITDLSITANGYVELDLLRVGTKIYVRGV